MVLVPDLAEEMDLVFGEEEPGSDRVHRRVAPALVVEAALGVEEVEELAVTFSSPEIQVANFKVTPD